MKNTIKILFLLKGLMVVGLNARDAVTRLALAGLVCEDSPSCQVRPSSAGSASTALSSARSDGGVALSFWSTVHSAPLQDKGEQLKQEITEEFSRVFDVEGDDDLGDELPYQRDLYALFSQIEAADMVWTDELLAESREQFEIVKLKNQARLKIVNLLQTDFPDRKAGARSTLEGYAASLELVHTVAEIRDIEAQVGDYVCTAVFRLAEQAVEAEEAERRLEFMARLAAVRDRYDVKK